MGAALVVALALLAAWGIQASAQAASPPPASDCSDSVFTEAFERNARDVLEGLAFTASAYDTRSECWYHLNPDLSLTTASAIKLQVLGANLDRVEGLGRSLNESEIAAAERMLWFSHNSPPTSQLYGAVGVSGMNAFSDAVGATTIQHNQIYGITWTPAVDLTRSTLATLNLEAPSPLTVESREVAREILADVHFTQTWGVGAGLPSDHEVWLKNGFFPCRSCQPFSGQYTWRVSSTGYIERPDTTGWAITVLTDGAQTQAEGIDAVETIAAAVSAVLGDDGAGPRPTARPNCTTVETGWTQSSILAALAAEPSDWTDIRWISGNEGPLLGQLMCAREPIDTTGLGSCICPRDRRNAAHELSRN